MADRGPTSLGHQSVKRRMDEFEQKVEHLGRVALCMKFCQDMTDAELTSTSAVELWNMAADRGAMLQAKREELAHAQSIIQALQASASMPTL